MPRGGSRKNSGRKSRDVFHPVHMWIVDHVRLYLAEGEKTRNQRWQKKHLRTNVVNHIKDANEHYANIEKLTSIRKRLLIELEKYCIEHKVQRLTEKDHTKVNQLKNVEIQIESEREDLRDIFENVIPSGGLLTPIPSPSHQDLSAAFKKVSGESSESLVKKVTVREVKDAWAAWLQFESQFKKDS